MYLHVYNVEVVDKREWLILAVREIVQVVGSGGSERWYLRCILKNEWVYLDKKGKVSRAEGIAAVDRKLIIVMLHDLLVWSWDQKREVGARSWKDLIVLKS